MTLKDAILTVLDECGAEYLQKGKNSVLRRRIFDHEYTSMNEAKLFEEVTGNAPIVPRESALKIYSWISFAFRFGMRVQRKLDHPDLPTTMSDVSYDHNIEGLNQ